MSYIFHDFSTLLYIYCIKLEKVTYSSVSILPLLVTLKYHPSPGTILFFQSLNIVSVMLSSKLIIIYAYSVFIFKVMHHVVHTDAGNSHLTLTSDNKYNIIYRYNRKCHSLFCHMTSNMA